ncbi:MAG: hypothetical protein ABI672_05055 [Vicinamibacteria bacterium]
MRRRWLTLALGLLAMASGPLALFGWNEQLGRNGFATPIGGDKWFATRPGFFEIGGVRDPELSPTGSVFNWTEKEATLRFPRLERSRAALLTFRIQGQPPIGTRTPTLWVSVDGVESAQLVIPTAPKRISVSLPTHVGRGAIVSLRVEDAVGVMIENVRLAPEEKRLRAPREANGALAFIGLAWFVAAIACGVNPWGALALAVLQTGALAWLSVRGGAFLGRYSESIAWLSLAGLIFSLITGRLKDPLWRRAGLAVICLSALKLSILAHPQLIDADAAFHAGNLRRVLSGDWFFTSATPPPAIPFPYPPGLSVVALPFTGLPQDTWVTLLRVIVVVTEVLASATFAVTIASLSSEAIGALTFVLLSLSPDGFSVLFIGNLSNLFAESLLLFGCSFVIARRAFMGALSLTGAFLSHFGTLLLGGPLSFLIALNQGEALARSLRRTAPVLAALAAAFLLYYWRFVRVVSDAMERMSYAKGAAAVGPMTAPVTEKLSRLSGGDAWWITAVIVIIAAIGVITWPRHERKPLARILFTWLLVIGGFTLLGLLTPVQVRSGLSARPALAALGASGLWALWGRGRAGQTLAVLLVLTLAGAGWLIAIGFFPARGA